MTGTGIDSLLCGLGEPSAEFGVLGDPADPLGEAGGFGEDTPFLLDLFLKLLRLEDVVEEEDREEQVLRSSLEPCGLLLTGKGEATGVGMGEGSSLIGERHLP